MADEDKGDIVIATNETGGEIVMVTEAMHRRRITERAIERFNKGEISRETVELMLTRERAAIDTARLKEQEQPAANAEHWRRLPLGALPLDTSPKK